eukprot:s627_g4.t1
MPNALCGGLASWWLTLLLWRSVGISCVAASVEFSLILDQDPVWEDAQGFKANEEAIALLGKKDALTALQTLQQAVRRRPSSVQLQNSVPWREVTVGEGWEDSGATLSGSGVHAARRNKEVAAVFGTRYLAKSGHGLKEELEEAASEAFRTAEKLATQRVEKVGAGAQIQADPSFSGQERSSAESDLEVAKSNSKLAQRHLETNRLNVQGLHLDRMYRWDEAAAVFRKAMTVMPHFDPRTANNLASVIYKNATYRSTGWTEASPFYREAQKLLQRALKLLPGAIVFGAGRVLGGNCATKMEDTAIPSSVPALDPELMTQELRAFVLEEKGLAMSGEDFEVKTPEGQLVLKINGGNRVPIPGVVWDKLSLVSASGQEIGSLDRQAFAMTASYDLKRADGQKFGRISKAMFAFTSTFELYQEDDPEGGPLLKAEGSFSDKNYVMKSRSGRVVATVTRLKGFTGGNVDNYQVIVAKAAGSS